MLPHLTPKDIERFWAKVDQSGGPDACWPWMAARFNLGYGMFMLGRKAIGAHRIARFIATNEDPGTLSTLHKCDYRACCNPTHLFLGTAGDNARDMVAKDRYWKGERTVKRGSANNLAKLTEAEVVDIRKRHANGESRIALARAFGVSKDSVGLIVRRRIWTHI